MIVDCIFLLLIMSIFTFYSREKMLMIYCDQKKKKKGYPAPIRVCVCLSVEIDQLRSMDLDLARETGLQSLVFWLMSSAT